MIKTAILAAERAGHLLKERYTQHLQIRLKKDESLVSSADRESEEVIRKTILQTYPRHAINGEECGLKGCNDYCWYIDPLDGTTNFLNHDTFFCVSIGLAKKGRYVLGVIYQPVSGDLFIAQHGKGAFLNNERLKIKARPMHKGLSLVDSSFRNPVAMWSKLGFIREWASRKTHFRILGSDALQLAEFARGGAVISYHCGFHPWDVAAGVVIAKEAGGIITDEDGKIPTVASTHIICANSKSTHHKALQIVRERLV
ncbi:MAG: inositol monophosphatase family protein [Nanoarchaeota archaeon]